MKKTLTMVLALVLVFALGVGGTLAWLSATTTPVVNTFTVGDINIDLNEHEYVPSTKSLATDKEPVKTNENYKFVPGDTLPKDPYVTVKAGSEACWLFVKLEKSEGFDTYLQYEMADDWIVLPSNPSVYYRKVDAVSADTEFQVIKGNKVTVKSEVTNELMDAVESANPTLTISAYAIQQLKFDDVADAWTEVSKLSNDNDYYTTTTNVQGTKVTVTH